MNAYGCIFTADALSSLTASLNTVTHLADAKYPDYACKLGDPPDEIPYGMAGLRARKRDRVG
jgi:hypothetical protein